MKGRNKIGALLLSICLLTSMFSVVTYAAAGSISITSKSGNVGSTVAITCTIRCSNGAIGTADVVLGYDQTGLQYVSGSGGYSLTGGAGSVVYKGLTADGTSNSLSFTVNFKILKQGAHTVSVKSANAYDIDEAQFTPTFGSGTITGTAPSSGNNNNNNNNNNHNNNNTSQNNQPDNRDSNNRLSSLQVYPGTLSPAFDPNTTSYSVTVPKDTKELTISAAPQSGKATVNISGGTDLKPGVNEAQVIVVAENGASIAYTITIMCGEEEKIQVGGLEYTIDESFTDDDIPEGFVRTQLKYKDREYEGLKKEVGEMYLLRLKNAEKADFFIYRAETREFYTFIQIWIVEGKYIIPLPLNDYTEEFAEYETTTLTVQDKSFDAWKVDDEFSVLYAMGQDGEEIVYRYDSVDGTFQRYKVTPIKDEGALFPNVYYMYAIIGLSALVVILFITVIYFIASRKHRRESRRKKMLRKLEKQKTES